MEKIITFQNKFGEYNVAFNKGDFEVRRKDAQGNFRVVGGGNIILRGDTAHYTADLSGMKSTQEAAGIREGLETKYLAINPNVKHVIGEATHVPTGRKPRTFRHETGKSPEMVQAPRRVQRAPPKKGTLPPRRRML